MLESYEAYADYNDVMNMVEEMVSEVMPAGPGHNQGQVRRRHHQL